jgi:hypothetical protein
VLPRRKSTGVSELVRRTSKRCRSVCALKLERASSVSLVSGRKKTVSQWSLDTLVE